ncbi:MAG: CRISPR-associated helicase Cas3' [Spirochaetaceae bacterium]|nr:CRISPR-associated helicase Cas3' [Spirochaetaceae bacterium]
MTGDKLLAKSGQDAPTLPRHCADVVAAFDALFGTAHGPSYLGRQWLRFFSLDPEAFPRFYANGVASCALHDLGKANDAFQATLERSGKQFIRHEHLSALVLDSPGYSAWLSSGSADPDVVVSAVLGHHLKASWGQRQGRAFRGLSNPVLNGESMRVLFDHADFEAVLRLAKCKAALPDSASPVDGASADTWDEEQVAQCAQSLRRRAKRMKQRGDSPDLWQMTRAVKTALIVADSVGSATLAREEGSIANWIGERFPVDDSDERVLTPAAIGQKIIEPRIAEIRRTKPDAAVPDDFQRAAEELGRQSRRALLLAPCGAGKTLAAWLWIKGVLRHATASRALFLYPTRGTTVEGFRDYVSLAPESDAALLHGAAKYDLRHQLQDLRSVDDDQPRNFEVDDRLAKLAYWDKRIFSATVHQFLAFMQQDYASMCLLPVLADSVVIVDEVHSFDARMFAALISLLREFDVPVLCMTASLKRSRHAALEAAGLQTYPRHTDRFIMLKRSAEMPRYRVEALPSANGASAAHDAVYRRVDTALGSGKRVLWVVNQVGRCQAVGQELEGEYRDLICYHSRFRHKDRARRHADAIASFARAGPVLAISTQVCEMSLDLDADLLITESAPIPSLIQRMGRCNRRAQHQGNHDRLGAVLICAPETATPYRDDELTVAQEFVDRLVALCEVSQRQLEDLLEELSSRMPADGAAWTGFIEDGFWSEGGGSFIEDDGWSVTAVLTEDLSNYRALRRKREPTDGLLLPCPRNLAQTADYATARDYLLPRHVHLAPSAHYSRRWGLLSEPSARAPEII